MRNKLNNVRFPHTCVIYRKTEETAFDDGAEKEVYRGVCRNYNNMSLRTFYENTPSGRVVRADYAVSIPLQEPPISIKTGDMIEIDLPNENVHRVTISDVYVGTMGITLFYNKVKN